MASLFKNTVFISLSLLISLVIPQGSYGFFGKNEEYKKYDSKRVNDAVNIAEYVEQYYSITGKYPLIDEPQQKMFVSIIANNLPQGVKPDFSYSDLEQELTKVLNKEIVLPLDPQDGDDWRFYQYATDGQNYYVSTFLYYARPYTQEQGRSHHKLEITSRPSLKSSQFKATNIKRFLTHGFENNDMQKKLFKAIESRDFEAAKQAILNGANPSPVCGFNHRCQPLATAAKEGDIELINFLIDNGADIDGYNAYYSVALIYALESKQTAAARLLIKSGANVNLPNAFGISPFIGVCATGDLEFAKLMIEHGANLDRNYLVQNSSAKPGQKNFRPIEAAIKAESFEILSLLLNAGANSTLTNSTGKTMLELASDAKNPDLKKLLERKSEH